MNEFWKKTPEWHEVENGWELSGPFFSITCEKIGDNFTLVLAAPQGELNYDVKFADPEVARNTATLWYNKFLSEMTKAVAENEPTNV